MCSGETDLVKKSEGEDVGLLSGTHVMEGSGRMIVVGVGLNSQVGAMMSLLDVTEDGNKSQDKIKDKKVTTRKLSTTKTKNRLAKQTVNIEDKTKALTTTVVPEISPNEERSELLGASNDDNENENKINTTTHNNAGELVSSTEDGTGANTEYGDNHELGEDKRKCK